MYSRFPMLLRPMSIARKGSDVLTHLTVSVVKNGYKLVVEKAVEKVDGEEKYLDSVEEEYVFESKSKLKKAIKLILDEDQ